MGIFMQVILYVLGVSLAMLANDLQPLSHHV